MSTPQLADYLDNTTPWAKQQEAFAAVLRGAPGFPNLFAATMEQRCGKLIVSLGVIAYRYEHNLIDAALVVAMPSGVPRNWADEIDGAEGRPARFPARIPHLTVVWSARRSSTKSFDAELEALLAFDGLALLLVNGEALLTEAFQKYAAKFLRKRRVFAIGDETSLLMKTAPGKNKGGRSRVMLRIKPYCHHRLILDGTPADESPLDLYSQFAWLDESFLGHKSFYSFKHYYAEWKQQTIEVFDPKLQKRVKRSFEAIVTDEATGGKKFAHLDELQRRLASCSFRVTRAQCFDIPDKLYREYRYDLSDEQRRVYDEIETEHESRLADGTHITVAMVLTRYLRLQQVLSNTYPGAASGILCPSCRGEGFDEDGNECENCSGSGIKMTRAEPRVIDRKHHPRLVAMIDIASVERGSLIVWARFTRDIDELMALGVELGRAPVRYDGAVPPDDKLAALRAFQRGDAGWIVANQAAMQRGVDASKADAMVFYSNTFSGLQRRQCEDRTEAVGRHAGTGVIDITADNTIDELIVAAHLQKKSVAAYVMQVPNTQAPTR
jgi:hypothetical protein